ncbi:MAG TPA: mannose-6-phosphate isomerase, class I [Saprospiraceae bacterium]|nr:mannose-6-phosphate isomerase, class I [Saprospiraceae bacterium]HMP25813.1 mannose-6-phosphate isomerase, class I [Saprospiraceae bacterium]
MSQHKHLIRLQGAVQHYDWGGFDYIPRLIRKDNPAHQPFAELWMGAHSLAPALVQTNGAQQPLDQFIAQSPTEILGASVAAAFQNRLPYLFKILDVHKMLSIQAHPSKAQAKAGFRRENEQGIPLDAPHRTYRDDNHKPEIMVALTDFWLLHGFKTLPDIQKAIAEVSEFQPLQAIANQNNTFELYRYIMEMPQTDINAMLAPLQQRLAPTQALKASPDYWVKQAFEDHPPREGHYDRGIFSIYFFNLLHLQPGQGIFQGAGIPHAYLEGVNVELMANSDNVFRGGLTNKHIDVPELLKSLIFEPVTPQILAGEALSDTEWVYRSPAPDFELRKIKLASNQKHHCTEAEAPHTLMVLEGEVQTNVGQTYARGDVFFAPAGCAYTLHAPTGGSTLFKSTVPQR